MTVDKKKLGLAFAASVICVLAGLILGFLILILINPAEAPAAMVTMLQNFLYYPRFDIAMYYLGMTIIKTTPVVMCALSFIYAKSAGLLNIGASGQYTLGAGAALFMAIGLKLPWWLCLIGAAVAGGLGGLLTGFLKAYRNANEVIVGILINWIALYLVNLLLDGYVNSFNYTLDLKTNAPQALIPNLGIDKIFAGNTNATLAIPLTIIAVIAVHYILSKTVLGYETRATGLNIHAARLAGMKEKENIMLTMFISGALCGLGAAFLFLCGANQWQTSVSQVPNMGFDAMAAAFLGCLNPAGSLFASFFIQHINMGSMNINKMIYPKEVSQIVVAVIIYFSAFASTVVRFIASRIEARKEKKQ